MSSNKKGHRNRYSLIVVNAATGAKTIIPASEFDQTVTNKNQEKTLLSYIDRMTTDYDSTRELLHYLVTKYIDPDVTSLSSYSVYIGYMQARRERKLGILTSKHMNLKYFSHAADVYVDIDNVYFQMFYDNFMKNIKDVVLYRHLKDNYLNPHILRLIEDYVYLDVLPPERTLMDSLSRYKVIRGILVGYNNFRNKERLIELDLEFDNIKPTKTGRPLRLNTEDDLLNTINNRDDIFGSYGYDLDTLADIPGANSQIADGLDDEKELFLK